MKPILPELKKLHVYIGMKDLNYRLSCNLILSYMPYKFKEKGEKKQDF